MSRIGYVKTTCASESVPLHDRISEHCDYYVENTPEGEALITPRPGLHVLTAILREGDTLVTVSAKCISTNPEELLRTMRLIKAMGCKIEFLNCIKSQEFFEMLSVATEEDVDGALEVVSSPNG